MIKFVVVQVYICLINLTAAGYALSDALYLYFLRQLSVAVVLLTMTNGLVSFGLVPETLSGLVLAVKAYALLIVWRVIRDLHREGAHTLDTFPWPKK